MSSEQPAAAAAAGAESDKAFLTRHGVPALVKEALGRLGAQQPADPLAFLAEFFASTEGRRPDVEQAHACLVRSHWQSPGFLFAAKEAFDLLRRLQRDECRVLAACGQHSNQLLELLLTRGDVASGAGGAAALLLQRLRVRPQAAVPFGRFYSAVLTAMAFRSYAADCAALFADAEAAVARPGGGGSGGGNNRAACVCLLQLLDSALAAAAASGDDVDESQQHPQRLQLHQQRNPQQLASTPAPASQALFSRVDGLTPRALQASLAAARPAPLSSVVGGGGGGGGIGKSRQTSTGPVSLADFMAEAAALFIRRLVA